MIITAEKTIPTDLTDMKKLIEIFNKKERLIIGVMSGTSLDGIDLALVRFSGTGPEVGINVQEFKSYPMPSPWRKRIRSAFSATTEELCRINYDIGYLFSDTIHTFCKEIGLPLEKLDAVGLHGQTLYHVHQHSTLQTGESEIVANNLNCFVISDFRSADIAVGGSGAPLVPYLDSILFSDRQANVVLLNLGGIGNVTFLPREQQNKILAFDTGPANAILNETVELITDGRESYDNDATYSRQGKVIPSLLDALLKHDYFHQPLPKSTGREAFGKAYVQEVISRHPDLDLTDILRTFVSLIAQSVQRACKEYLKQVDRVYVSGGGAHHPLIMEELTSLMKTSEVTALKEIKGISVDSKEAVAFALLAHEWFNNTPTNLPSVTGAKRPTILGKLTVPF